MKDEKRRKVNLTNSLVASICFYVVSIMSFIYKSMSVGIIFLGLGSSFLCLSTKYLNKKNNNNEDK